MTFRASVLTLYPDMFPGPLGTSLAGRALEEGIWSLEAKNIREFAADKHRSVDDTPAGGGAGMVLRPDVLAAALDSVANGRPMLALTPRGTPLTQQRVRALASGEGVILLCGRFEGFDERIFEARALEPVSIGDYVLSGGELAALVILDSVGRLVPGVVGDEASVARDTFTRGLLDYPQYTRPAEFRGMRVPPVLLSGHHGEIERWRRREALARTLAERPEMLETASLDATDQALLEELRRKKEIET